MIRFLFRFLGLMALAAAFVLVVYDGVRFIANHVLNLTTVVYVWTTLHQSSLDLMQRATEQHAGPWLWRSAIQPYFLEQPASVFLIVIGAILILLGRRKRPLIGYAR